MDHSDSQRTMMKVYDEWGEAYGTMETQTVFISNAIEESWIKRMMRFVPTSRWLDVCCGKGRHAEIALETRGQALEVICVDLSRNMVKETCRKLGSRAHYIVADAKHLPLKNGSFNLVLGGLIDNVLGTEFIQEINRVLKLCGHFIFSVPDAEYYYARARVTEVEGWMPVRLSRTGKVELVKSEAFPPEKTVALLSWGSFSLLSPPFRLKLNDRVLHKTRKLGIRSRYFENAAKLLGIPLNKLRIVSIFHAQKLQHLSAAQEGSTNV